jgi:hypothetical protein
MSDDFEKKGELFLPKEVPQEKVCWSLRFDGELQAKVRLAIVNGLIAMNNELAHFDQTCHGSMGPTTIEGVCEIITALWNGTVPADVKLLPKFSWLVSELSQRIEKL